jgi:hypothetical protein
MLFHLANLPYWIFLCVGIGFLLLVTFTGGGDDDLDADGDFDLDADSAIAPEATLEVDTDVSGNGDGENGFLNLRWLPWLGVGQAPLLVLLGIDFSAWGVTGWMANVFVGSLTGRMPQGWLAGTIAIASLVLALWVGKLLSRPIGKAFASFSEDASSDRVLGCVGTVTSKTLPYLSAGEIGQVHVFDSAGNLLTLSVSLPDWATVVPHYKDKILIIDRRPHCFIAIAKDTSDEDRWLNSASRPDSDLFNGKN